MKLTKEAEKLLYANEREEQINQYINDSIKFIGLMLMCIGISALLGHC